MTLSIDSYQLSLHMLLHLESPQSLFNSLAQDIHQDVERNLLRRELERHAAGPGGPNCPPDMLGDQPCLLCPYMSLKRVTPFRVGCVPLCKNPG